MPGRPIFTRIIILLAVVSTAMAYRYGKGPQTGCTNAPGESSCRLTDCHAQYELNSGDGSLTLQGIPAVYNPGRRYVLTVTLAQKGQKRWGFQLTALTTTHQPAGDFSLVPDSLTQIKTATFPDSSIRQYVEHTAEGSFVGRRDGPVNWDLIWTAPEQPTGDIVFYTAANAANFNKKPWGDYIYTRADTSHAGSAFD